MIAVGFSGTGPTSLHANCRYLSQLHAVSSTHYLPEINLKNDLTFSIEECASYTSLIWLNNLAPLLTSFFLLPPRHSSTISFSNRNLIQVHHNVNESRKIIVWRTLFVTKNYYFFFFEVFDADRVGVVEDDFDIEVGRDVKLEGNCGGKSSFLIFSVWDKKSVK